MPVELARVRSPFAYYEFGRAKIYSLEEGISRKGRTWRGKVVTVREGQSWPDFERCKIEIQDFVHSPDGACRIMLVREMERPREAMHGSGELATWITGQARRAKVPE